MEDKLYKAWQSAGKYYDLPDYDTFKKDMKDEGKLHRFHESLGKYYDVPDYDAFKADMWGTAAEQQPTGQAGSGEATAQKTGAAPAGQTTSAGEIMAQAAQQEQPTVEPSASQTRAQVKPAAVQQSAPVYKYTYFDESAIDPNEGELRMSMKPANWAYSERVNKSRGSHTKDNSPILRMSLDGGKLDVDVEREALADLKGMSDDEIYKYTNDLYNLTWGELTNEQRRDAASRLAAAGYELHVRDLGLGHAGDVDRNTDEVQTNLQDPKYRKLYDQGQWADPVDALSRQYDRLFAEQATGGTMGQQQATKMANRVLRAADKDQMFTWALQEAERTGGDPYKIYENIYDRFHAAVKDKLGAYNTRGQAAGLLGDIDAMIAEKWRAAEEADRSSGFNFGQMLAGTENGGTRIADRLMDDPDMWALQYAKRTIEGVNNLIAEADHNAASGNFGAWLESSFAGGVARGFGQSVFDVRTWDMGFGDVRDATALMTALDKSDKGQPLTKAEQAMLDAKAVELAANAYFKSQVGYGYEAGKVTGESLPFMLEMMINPASKTGGLAVNKLVRYALKRFPQRGAAAVERQAVRAAERQAVRSAERSVARSLKGKILESAGLIIETAGKKTAGGKAVRAAVKTAGNVAGSAVMAGTTGLPGVIADTENRMIGQLDYDTDESGKAHVTGHGFGVPMITAFKQALVARGIENVTEMSEFDVLSEWLGGLTRKALDKLHMSDVYKFFDDIRMSDVAKVVQDFEKNTHWQGTFGEYLEEVEGGILNAWLVGDQTLDQDPDTGVFNVDNNVKTFLGVSLLGGAFSAVQTVGYRTPKARMRKDIEDADKQASELWGGTWQQFKNSVDGADDEEMEALLANIVVNGNYSVDQRRAAAQYIKSVVAYRGAMKGEEIRAVDGESNPEDEQSYEQGYQVQGREREQVQDDLQRAEQRLDELDFDLSSFEGWTSDAFEERIASGEHDYTDEDIEAIREYFRAKAASDGMHQRVEDDIDTQVQQASDLVDKQTNQGTGMVHRATLNDGQEVYVTGGQLVMTGDGTMIDTEASDQSLFVYNPATGQAEQYNPSDFQSVDDPVNPEQLKSEAARDIRQAAEQQAEADMNGYVQQGESYDMVDEQGNALHGTVLELRPDNTAVVQVDGEQMPLAVPTQQLQTWVDNAKQIRMSMEPAALPTRGNEGQATDADTGRVGNATNETIEAPAVEPMVMDEKTGEPVWLQSTPERGYQYLVNESGLIGDDITSLIDDRIAQAEAAIEKSSKGGTIDERLAARQAKNYWEAVKTLHDAAQSAAIPQQAGANGRGTAAAQRTGTTAQQSPTGQATTTGQAAPAGTVRVEANQAETMPVGYTAVNIDGTRAEDRGQLGIRPEDEAYFLKTMSPRVMRLLDKVAKSLGWKIRLYNGENSQERGLYNDGVVWVNRRAMTSKLAQWILGHEMTHGMGDRTRRGETFKDYKAMATAYHRSQVGDEQYEREVASLIKAYQDHLRSLGMDTSVVTREYVEEEIACDVTGDLLMNNPEMIGKLFSGVESPGKVKGIIDMIVDFLNYLKSKLPWRSEEREAFDDLIKRLNNLYRDAKAQTDIAKATAREEGSQIESGEGEREGKSFSITGNAEGSGFTASETVLEIWRVPQEDGTYKEEEHWVKKPLLDSEGNVVFRMGDKEFSGKNPITVDDLKSNPDTVLNYMLADALNAGTIDETKADQVRQQYADMLNLYLEKGMATEDGNGFENLEKKWLWVGETVFRTVASNSDEQYSYSMDITKVCKKNEAVIRAISALQVKTGYGVTPAQILEIYETTDAEGFQVPCPVCYVFSRYINNGKYATAIVNGMKKYGKYLPGQPDAKPVEWWVKEMKDAQTRAKKMETPIKNANDDVKVILQQIDALCREITSGKLSKEEAESKRRHVRALDQRYRAALDVISQEALPRWIKAFVIEGSDQGGWSLREDAALPEDMDDFTLHALDIRKTASAMEKYPSLTRYRRAGGSAGGKEITFASNNELGTIAMGLGISKDKLDDYPNYYQLAAEASTDEERQALLQKARERYDKAMLYAQRQTLRGGQRMWSWSDNIESLSSDVASNLMQLELLGGALQTYSKQLEGVKMVAAMNGYVNASLMGYGDGIREVGPDEIENGRLKDDIWDVNNKGRRRIIANAGSPVYHNEADGKDYVLVFDDVVGIDPFGHGGKRGLFSLNEEYDRAGNILVGMNDIHVRAAMADPRVFFIIPWHASGMSNHILKQMFNILGVNMDQFVSTDYTKMQEETNYLLKKDDGSPKKKVPKEVEDFWDSHTYEDEFACGTGHIENGDRDGGLSESQLHYRALRDAIFDGAVKEGTEEYDQIMADEFLSQVYRQVTTRVADGKMTEKDKEFIYPYEYWQMTEVDENGNEVPARVENADVNGRRYVEYCRRMGFKPKFTGKYDDKTGYSPEGNFADDPGYWKLLIDRRMYDRRGNYQDLTPVDSSGLDSSMYDPDQTSEEFNVTEVATNEGAEKIADAVYQNDIDRTGSMPAPNLDMTMDEAVARYKAVTSLQASLIKAEKEALTAADVAKQKAEKAKALKAADVDGRKAKSVARAQESARKAMEAAKQKAREVEEIASKFGDNGRAVAHGTNARFSLEDPRFREVVNNGGRLQIIQSRKGTFRDVYDYETGERRKVRSSHGGWRIEGMPGEYDSREAAINEWRERSSGDLLWSVSDDGKYIEVEGEGDALERLSGRANDTGRAERWAQQRAENGRRIADDMAGELGVTVHYVDDMTDEERAALSDRQRRAKGWFDPRTGDVYINLGNHNRLYDIVSTVLHNVVANKGLRGLFGESFPGFLDQVYNNVDKHTRAEIDRIAERNDGDRRDATEEYLALMAERMDIRHPENYQYYNDAVREFVIEEWKDGNLKWGHAIEDDDLRRVLFESYHNMQREGAMGMAQSVAFRDQVERERAAQNAAIPRQANAVAEDDGVRFSIRTKPAPKKTRKAYKLMRLVDGKLYPLFIGNNEEMKLHTWYDADSPALDMLTSLEPGDHLLNMETGETMTWDEYAEQHVPKDKNGKPKRGKPNVDDIHWANENGLRFMHIEDKAGSRSENDARKKYGDTRLYYNWGINGSKDGENGEGSASLYALRPGLHTGAVCSMPQIGYDNPDGGTMRLDNQVWVEVEMADDVDYQSEAESNASRDIPTHIPVDGNYRYATNPTQKKSKSGDTETDKQKGDWYVTGAMKITKILSDEEADEVVRRYNKKYGTNIPLDYRRRGGRVFNAETMQLEEPSSEDSEIRFSFGGPIGAEAMDALDSGRRMADLDVAKEMERAGKDARTIKLATGWERGTDNKWRYEMADVSPIVFKLSKAKTLGDIVDMNGLDEVYPILKEYSVSFKGVSRGAAGEVSHKRKEIKMSKTYNTERVGVGNYILDDYGMKTIVHEIQHVIQKVEGFARGTNENMEAREALQERRDGTESPELLYFAAGIAYNNTPGNLIAYGNESLAWKLKSTFPDRNSKQWQLGDYIEKMDPWLEYRDFVYRAANLIKYAKKEGPKRYHNSAGETEARNVEKRYGMSAEERRGSLAEETEDVPRSEQILRYEGDNSERRFSIDEESQRVFDTAKRKFGETKDIREAGYVLPDGVMLDFSGRHELDPGTDSSFLAGRRATDHRAISQISFVYDENGDEVDTGVSSDMPDFIRRGAIRIDNNAGSINLSAAPTMAQRRVLRELIRRNGGDVQVDFGDGWNSDHYVEYEEASAQRVLGDIDRYFDEGIKPEGNVRFSLADTFYSNAAKAVEGVKQEKAKAEQWKAMLTKAGGIKAGEDKWMGLSTWLDEHKGETLTKEQVRQFVAENGIQMEETHYSEYLGDAGQEQLDKYRAEYADAVAHVDDIYKAKADRFSKYCNTMEAQYGEEWFGKMTQQERMTYNVLAREQEQADPQINDRNDIAFQEMVDRYGDDFGVAFEPNVDLDGNPTLIPNLDYDDNMSSAAKYFLGVGETENELINPTRQGLTTKGLKNNREIAFVVPDIEPYQENDEIHFGPENQGRAIMWVRFGEATDADGNRVLVIDEIQSNRHQDAREKGYKETANTKGYKVEKDEHGNYIVTNKDGETRTFQYYEVHSENEAKLYAAQLDQGIFHADGIPAAPFEKNWHEVAMKRMLRLAAEEGFDKVAWTTGEQQADRYDLRKQVTAIVYKKLDDGTYRVSAMMKNGEARALGDLEENRLADAVGKELSQKIIKGDGVKTPVVPYNAGWTSKNTEEWTALAGDDLKIGGEGMKGFYDGILPSFMNKYGKRWGVKTGEVQLSTPGKEVMHSVDVNEDMKRSVMQGQPLFSLGVEQERTLMGMHNITAEKLRSALKLGGLANPSMAVINTEVGGFTNFGEISLIPSADLIASRTGDNAGTWGADAYSPRFPETHRRLGKGGDKKMRAWVKGLKMRKEMEYNTEEQFNDYYNGFNIRDNALVYPFLHEKGLSDQVDYYTHMNVDQRLEDDLREVNGDQWALLNRFDEDDEYKKKLTDIVVGDELRKINKKEGETFQEFRDRRREWAKEIRETLTEEDGYINRNLAEDLLWGQARAYKENGKFSESRTRDNAEQYIRDHGLEEEYKQYFDDKMQELGAELQVYAGSDSQGRSKYKPVSLDQVSRMMKRQGRAGGEGGIFADSPGAIRAKLLTPMKTLDQIRAKKDRLVSHEAFEQFRERYQEELREYADVYARGSMGALADIITSNNMAATAKQYNIDLDADAVAELNKFKNRVRALPTEYFETKFERPVMLEEFKKAVIPDDLPLDLQGALQRAGLEVVEYKHGDNADRERVTLDAVKNDDSIRFSLSQRERDYTANVLKKLRKAGVNVQLATDEEAQRVLDTAEQVDAELMRGWHGSSADFDAFDHSHMGEGEGAQAYGWGTYITEVEGIARQYAGGKPSAATIIKLSNSRRAVQVLDTQVQGMKKLLIENTRNLENTNRWIDEAKKELADFIKRFGADSDEVSDWHRQRDEQMEFWQDDADSYKRGIKSIKQRLPKYEKRLQEAKDELNNLEEKFNESGGRFLYEVSIPENNGSNYLPYDQVLSEETSKRLVDAIKPLYEETRANREKYIEEIAAIREPAQQKFGDDWLKSLPAESQERFEELIELQTSAQKKEADLRSVLVYIDAGDELLRWQSKLEKALGKKETSEFLSGLGYVGVEYPAMFRSGGREDGAKNYVIFNEGDAKIVNKTEFLKTSDGTVYGWHDNDGIHLTAAGLNPNTPMHEYTHGLMAMLKEREPEKYQQIVEALKDSEVWQEVLNDELYSSIRDDVDAVASEVASRLSGRESERRANESMPARIKRAIQELWETVAEWFGVKSPMTTDSIARMTLRELERGTNPDGDGPGGGTNGGDGPRFSLSGDGTVEEYNKAVNMTGRTFNMGGREVKPGLTRYNFQEAFQDAILAVKKLQQVVERHFGIKLPTRENAWMYENRLSSINMHERKSFIDKVYEPMMKIADRIMKRGVKEKDLNAYLICKHGLERNQVFAARDAQAEADEIARNGGVPDMQQLLDKYRQRDYSGLTGVTGIEGDITDIEAEAQRIVDEFEQKHGQLCNELWDAIRKATQWSLRKSYQSGMMSAATFDHVRNMFQYYVPLRGWSETTAEDVYSYMMGEHGAFNGVLKKAEGRTSVADDPLATIGNMAESALMQGNKNLLKQHLLRMAQNHPTDVCQVRDVWLVEGPGGVWEPHWPNIPEDATPDEIDQILQDHEADMQQLEASGQAKRVRNNLDIPYRIDPKHVPEHAVVAKVAGVDHVIYINGNPRAAQAINGQTGAGRGTKSGFSRLIDFIFGDVKRFYSSVLTSLNINFSGANFVRDLPHAYAMTFIKQGPLKAAEYIAKSFQVIPWVFKNQLGKTGTSQMDRYFQEFLSSGSVTGYAHINDVDAWKADNKRRFARLSALGKAKVAVPRALGEVINAIGWFSETLELIPRFTAFLAERQAGKDIATATKAAKDITTNFNKKGSEVTPGVWGAVANTLRYMKMFFNPIVQGMYQFVDVASMGKENKWVGPRMVLATMHLPVLGAIVPYLNQFLLEALGGDDDDDYWLLNEYTRRNNVCIFTGNGYVKIPIAPVFRELYGMGEVVATRHAGKADNEKTTIDLIDQLRTMGSVEGQSSYNEWSLARFLLPEHFAPLIDVMNNENFTGGPIYYDNNYKEYAPEYTKAKKSTWSPLVAASKWLNEMMGGDEDIAAGNSGKWMNPAVWQHLITNVGGGFAQLAGDVVSGATDIAEGKEIDPSNMPVLKRFYSASSDERANWARFGIYKDYEKDYAMAKEKYQALDKRGLSPMERADEIVKFAETHPKAAAIYAVWEGGIKGADIPQQLSKMGKDDPKYWDLVKEAVGKAEKAMNSGYVRAWEQKRKDRPDSMSDKELNDRFDKSDNDSIRHIMADEISKRAGSQDYYGRDAQAAWSDKSVAAWEAYQDQRTSDDIKADAELSNLLKVDEDEKDKERIKMLGFIKDELNKIRRGKDATSRSAGVKGLGEGDDQRVMNELRAARKQLIEDLKTGSAEQAYRNLERRTMRLGLRKKAKEL